MGFTALCLSWGPLSRDSAGPPAGEQLSSLLWWPRVWLSGESGPRVKGQGPEQRLQGARGSKEQVNLEVLRAGSLGVLEGV